MQLQPFRSSDAAVVAGWARTLAEVRVWCSLGELPVPAATVEGWSADASVVALVVRDIDDRPAAYGELWIDDDEGEVELGHLIVDPSRRGVGVGRMMARRLVERARVHHPTVALRVRPDNEPARRCYAAAGFVRATPAEEAAWNVGQPVEYVWMVVPVPE